MNEHIPTPALVSTAVQRDKVLRSVRAAAEEYHRAAAAATTASEALEAQVLEARRLRVAWPELAEATGLTARQLQWRVPADEPDVAPAPDPKFAAPRRGPRPGRGPGVGIEEAAKILGVSRTSVYKWINSGRLESTTNDLGQRRVLGLEDLG